MYVCCEIVRDLQLLASDQIPSLSEDLAPVPRVAHDARELELLLLRLALLRRGAAAVALGAADRARCEARHAVGRRGGLAGVAAAVGAAACRNAAAPRRRGETKEDGYTLESGQTKGAAAHSAHRRRSEHRSTQRAAAATAAAMLAGAGSSAVTAAVQRDWHMEL